MKAFKSNGNTVNLITEDDVKPTGGVALQDINTNFNDYGSNVIKSGNTVQLILNISIKDGQTAAGNTVIGKIPAGYRPISTFQQMVMTNQVCTSPIWLEVGTDGSVKFQGGTIQYQDGRGFRAIFTYLTNG